jgi:hypothetical protein
MSLTTHQRWILALLACTDGRNIIWPAVPRSTFAPNSTRYSDDLDFYDSEARVASAFARIDIQSFWILGRGSLLDCWPPIAKSGRWNT